MAKATSNGSGTVAIKASEVQVLLREATGLPTTFFVTITQTRVLADGSLEAKYTFSSEAAPPPPP